MGQQKWGLGWVFFSGKDAVLEAKYANGCMTIRTQ